MSNKQKIKVLAGAALAMVNLDTIWMPLGSSTVYEELIHLINEELKIAQMDIQIESGVDFEEEKQHLEFLMKL